MRIRDRVAGFFNVQVGEGRSTSLMLAHSFFMGLSTVFFETAASALFLSRFGADRLPYVYLAAAALNTVTGLFYTTIQSRVSFKGLMTGTLLFLLVTTAAFRAGLVITDAGWLMFALLVFYRVISILTDLEYWAVAARLYDVRQAKRLFGLIGSGEVIARIAGAFSVPLLLAFTGVANLLVLSAVALASCLALLLLVLSVASPSSPPSPAGRPGAGTDHPGGGLEMLRLVLGNRYLRLIVSVAFFAVLGKYFVDFAFLEQMRSRYGDEKGIAAFFGLFSGASQTLSLLTRVFFSGRILNRYGVKAGLLVLPAAHVVCTVLIIVMGVLPWTLGLVFWLVVANQGIYKTLKHPIDNPSFKVLYQPLPKGQRLAAQIAVETIVTPVTIGVAGLVMLAFSVLTTYDPVHFAFALLLAFGGWGALAVSTGREYGAALVRALKGRIEDIPFTFDTEEGLAVLRTTLGSGRPADVLFALDRLERSERGRVGPWLADLLTHPSPDVRLSALLRIERHRPAGALPAVREHLAKEPDLRLRAAALRALAALGGEEVFEELEARLTDPEPPLRLAALIGLLKAGSRYGGQHLSDLGTSANPRLRLLAARAIGEAAVPGGSPPLRALLADDSPEVRRAALAAAGKLGAAELWPVVLASLGERAYGGAAANALVSGGQACVGILKAAFVKEAPRELLTRIVRVLGRIGGSAALSALRERLDFPVVSVRQVVLEGLSALGYQAEPRHRAAVLSQLRDEAKDAAWKLAVLRDLGSGSALSLLRTALENELSHCRERVFLLLSFVYDRKTIGRARENRAHPSREKRAYALEVLDVTLDADLKAWLMPLLDDLPQVGERLAPHFPEPERPAEERLRELLARSEAWLYPWTQACALDAAARCSARELAGEIETIWRSGSSAFVRQTGGQAIASLRSAGEAGGPFRQVGGSRRPMQTIEKVITLKAVHMFAEASEDDLADVAAILEEVSYRQGDVIFEKGEVGDSLYIIIEGRVRVYDGERTIVHLGERDIFGELALLDPEPRFASIAADQDTRLFRLDREAFLELMAGNIEIVRGVLHVLCERLRKSTAAAELPEAAGEASPGR
jgi:HEAT repeat protein